MRRRRGPHGSAGKASSRTARVPVGDSGDEWWSRRGGSARTSAPPAPSRQGDRRARDVCTCRGVGTLARNVIAGSRPRRLANVWALTCKREREARSADRRDCQVQCFVAQRLGWRFAAWASRSRKGYMPTGRQASGLRRRGPVARPAAKMKFKRRPAPESLMSRLAGWPR